MTDPGLRGRRVCVTGGAGFIGSHVVDAFSRLGALVTVIDDLSTGSIGNLGGVPDFEFVEGDILDPDVATVAGEADLVVHMAVRNVRASLSAPLENFEVNAAGTLQVLEAVRRGERGRFVYISSSEVYGSADTPVFSESTLPQPTTIYGAGKLAGELNALAYHRTYGLDACVVRPFNNYGPRSHFEGDSGEVIPKFILRALAGEPLLVHGDGTQTRDFMFVDDTAAWLAALVTEPQLMGCTVNIGLGREISVIELAEAVVAQTGSSSEIRHIEARPGDLARLRADVSQVHAICDYRPRVEFTEGLMRTVDYMAALGDPHVLLEQEKERTWI